MDRSIIALLSESAKNFLSTSNQFEPFVPQSQQNTLLALHLLEGLAELTRCSLEPQKVSLPPQQPSREQSPREIVKEDPQATKDRSLIEALIQLRNSRPGFKKASGISSSIIRPNQP